MHDGHVKKTGSGWRRFITPHAAILGVEDRRRTERALKLTLSVLLLVVLGLLILPLGDAPDREPYFLLLGGLLLVVLAAYALGGGPQYRAAITPILGGVLVFPLLLLTADHSPVGLRNAFPSGILALGVSAFLPLRAFAAFAALDFGELVVLTQMLPGVPPGMAVIYVASTLAVITLVVIGFRHYVTAQREHRRKLVEANERLRDLTEVLEQRLADRTSEMLEMERKFQLMTDNNPLAIMRFYPDLRFAYANPAAKSIFAAPGSGTLTNAPLSDYRYDRAVAPLAAFLAMRVRKTFADGENSHIQSAIGGREFAWWLVAERNEDQQVSTVLVTGMDVTERRRIERQIIESEARFRAISDASPLGIYVDSTDGSSLYSNHVFQVLTGLTDEELRTSGRDRVIHPEDRERLRALRERMLSTPPYLFESVFRLLRTDGRIVWVNSKEAPMWDEGNLIGFVGVIEDITARVDEINARLAADEALRQRSDELETALGDLEGFSYTVAHDLRAPLRAIDGFANILQREYQQLLPSDGMRLLDTIRRSAQQMGMLIDELLAFSRLGRHSLSLQMVDMNSLAQQAADALAPEREGRNLAIVIHHLPLCYGDPALLRQVWLNLLSNAVKFTRLADPAEIEIGTSSTTGKQVTYFVRDNGAGFDMAFSAKLFGVFQRLHRADEFEGTGVGLAIVHRIVLRHDGKIWAKSSPGEGATFYFSLPSKPPEESNLASASSDS